MNKDNNTAVEACLPRKETPMKKLVMICGAILMVGVLTAEAQWKYEREITFPETDTSFVVPFLCTIDANGRLYAVSSTATTINAHNAIYYADPGDTVFTLMVDFFENGDSDSLLGNIGSLRGIAAMGTDILINAAQPYQKTAPSTLSCAYYYENGDTNQVYKVVATSSATYGYGTYNHGFALTRDTLALGGVTAGAGSPGPYVRFYDFRKDHVTGTRGGWYSETTLEAGGTHSAGFDVIRDCAVIPDGDYTNPSTPFYSSRNSASAAQQTGGISVWTGGTQEAPNTYTSQRAADAVGFLGFGTFIPYGITVDSDGYLWVTRGDSSGRAVKVFDMSAGIFANEITELPGQNSPWAPDPTGAPMLGPVDVAVSGDMKKAYVLDYLTRSAFEFSNTAVSVADDNAGVPSSFTLDQNFPNPFNPTTTIAFTLARSADVKLTVTNSLGQEIATLVNGSLPAGKHVRTFTAGNMASGVYFYTLTAGTLRETRSMVLVK